MSGVVKRSLTIRGHRTSISLEEPFWRALTDLAEARGCSIAALVAEIDESRMTSGADYGNLSSAIRVFLFTAAQARPENA